MRWLWLLVILSFMSGGCTQYVREYHFIVYENGMLEIGDIDFLMEYVKQDEASQSQSLEGSLEGHVDGLGL